MLSLLSIVVARVRLTQTHQIIWRDVSYLERDRLIMDDAKRMVELVRRREIASVLGPTGVSTGAKSEEWAGDLDVYRE